MADTMPDPWQVVYWRGVKVNRRTQAMIREAETRLGSTFTLYQGWNPGGVDACAGTHDGTGVVDLWAPGVDPHRQVRALRNVGFAAWHRHPPLFSVHVHAVAIGDRGLSSSAESQVVEYLNGGDGLIGATPDEFPYRPDPPTWPFNYRKWWTAHQLRGRLATLSERIADLRARRRRVRVRLENLS